MYYSQNNGRGQSYKDENRLRAPFNFVPISDKVIFPDWADKISHDVPFKDGVSGKIRLTITARSPICIGEGLPRTSKTNNDKENAPKYFIKDPDGRFFIPATSIKGCIRNVLEIRTFSKLSKLPDRKMAIRDLREQDYLKYFNGKSNYAVHCGWLDAGDDKVTLEDCGTPRWISHEDIRKFFGVDIISSYSRINMNNDSNRSAEHKYSLFNGKSMEAYFVESYEKGKNRFDDREFVSAQSHNGLYGSLVLTGQPSSPGKRGAKHSEFVFLHNQKEDIKKNTIPISREEYEEFKSIYENSDDLKYYENSCPFYKKRIPVFFLLDLNSGDEKEIDGIGLSYLFKRPFPKKVKEYLPDDHKKKEPDMSECIFGYTTKDDSLKGRVYFSNAYEDNDKTIAFNNGTTLLLQSPRHTYYPFYMRPDNKKEPVSMLNPNAVLRGYKRYPVRDNIQSYIPQADGKDKKMLTTFYPLNAGTQFSGEITFWNLKPVELGALLAAIGTDSGRYHSLGQGKPYGYGKVSISISGMELKESPASNSKDVKNYIDEFNSYMEGQIRGYGNSEQITELELMMRPQNLKESKKLEYMSLEEFAKQKKHTLPKYSEIIKQR